MQYVNQNPSKHFREKNLWIGAWQNRNFDGDTLERGVFADAFGTFQNYWNDARQPVPDAGRVLRPAHARRPAGAHAGELELRSELRQRQPQDGSRSSVDTATSNGSDDGSYSRSAALSLTARPLPNLQLSVAPTYRRSHDHTQYVTHVRRSRRRRRRSARATSSATWSSARSSWARAPTGRSARGSPSSSTCSRSSPRATITTTTRSPPRARATSTPYTGVRRQSRLQLPQRPRQRRRALGVPPRLGALRRLEREPRRRRPDRRLQFPPRSARDPDRAVARRVPGEGLVLAADVKSIGKRIAITRGVSATINALRADARGADADRRRARARAARRLRIRSRVPRMRDSTHSGGRSLSRRGVHRRHGHRARRAGGDHASRRGVAPRRAATRSPRSLARVSNARARSKRRRRSTAATCCGSIDVLYVGRTRARTRCGHRATPRAHRAVRLSRRRRSTSTAACISSRRSHASVPMRC